MPPFFLYFGSALKWLLLFSVIAVAALFVAYIVCWWFLSSPRRKPTKGSKKSLNICFIHPDLGLGGAEKLVVETAVLLKQSGHNITLVTCRHDPTRCFPATADGTLRVVVAGDQFPRAILGRFQILCAIVRFFLATVFILKENRKQHHTRQGQPFDIFFVDQVSATIPILKWANAKVLFYCHYPDQLLSTRTNIIKWIYRLPFDFLEAATTAMADRVLVNSKFTASVFKRTFTAITKTPTVLYPAVDPSQYTFQPSPVLPPNRQSAKDGSGISFREGEIVLLSVNRFERKKNIALAIQALRVVFEGLDDKTRERVMLYIAGGYDAEVPENKEHLKELKDIAINNGVEKHIRFCPSVSDGLRNTLLRRCLCLLYTPSNEHFGIVPLEAALAEKPVIACNSGGPLETVVDGQTGFLRQPKAKMWAEVMLDLISHPEKSTYLGQNARQHVLQNFSSKKFTQNLETILDEMIAS